MFPGSSLPPPLYPGLLSPFAEHSSPLTRSLPSGFLVEDLLRLSQPASYVHQAFTSRSPAEILQLSTGLGASPRAPGLMTDLSVLHCSIHSSRSSTGSPKTVRPDTNYLKFGVSAILEPSTQSGESKGEKKDDNSQPIMHNST